MKSYFLSVGEAPERALPTFFSALSGGITREVPELRVLRILSSAPAPLADALLQDLNACRQLFSGRDDVAFFRTRFTSSVIKPALPGQDALRGNAASSLLLTALRGENMPLSFRTDPEAVEWSFSSLLESGDGSLGPLLAMRDEAAAAAEDGEDVRITLLCDLSDGFSAGVAAAVLRFLRGSFGENAPFLGLILWTGGGDLRPEDRLTQARAALNGLAERGLIRPADDRPTNGADASWLVSLPSALIVSEDSLRIATVVSARILAEICASRSRPSSGMHTRELPGTLTLRALDTEAKPAAAFLRSAVWCLSDLFPALRQFFEHPALLRSLAPSTRNGLFRRLFGVPESGGVLPEGFVILERAMKVILLEGLSLLRSLPETLREAEAGNREWREAVRACGRVVTLGSEYDVSRAEAEASGMDRVAPVHRESMADTAEEELLRKLDTMAADLSAAVSQRAEIFRGIGGFRARQALEDCLSRCHVAEVSAREKLSLLPDDTPESRYAFAVQERRVRMLQAAVARCGEDLRKALELPALSAHAPSRHSPAFAGEMLDPGLAEQCFTLLTDPQAPAEELRRGIRDNLSVLLAGYPLNDTKTLLRNLLSVCRQPDPDAPLRGLMTGVFSVCGVEVSGLRFQPAGEQPEVPLLPDLTEGDRFLTVGGAAARLLSPARRDRTAEKRGLLAMLLLRQYRRRGAGEADLRLDRCLPEDSALSRVYLSSRNAEEAWIVSLEASGPSGEEGRKLPFAVILPGAGVEPAWLGAAHAALVPPFAVWFQPETPAFEDPCAYFSEGDRRILTELFTRLRVAMNRPSAHAFADFLSDWHTDVVQAHRPDREDPYLEERLKAACGLSRLPAWRNDLLRISSFYERGLAEDRLCGCLAATDAFPAAETRVPDDILYTFRGVPFARESSSRLLESTCLPEEAHLLSSLNAECEILSHSSDDYHEALIAGLTDLLLRCPDADPEARKTADDLLARAREPVGDQVTELRWPWDTVSASVQTILCECLGPALGREALHPFSDLLTLFPARGGEIVGDTLLSRMCTLEASSASSADGAAGPESAAGPEAENAAAVPPPDAVLPPLSDSFCVALGRLAEGRTLLQAGLLTFARGSGQIEVALHLEGAFSLRLVRVYREEEILRLYSHDMPTLALWPSVPFPAEDWHAYFAYAHLTEPFRITAYAAEGPARELSGAAPRFVSVFPSFPVSFTLWREDRCAGSLPNLLPVPEAGTAGAWTACLDFGSSASSVVFSAGGSRWPLQGPEMVRTLLRSPAASSELLWREFLPSVPVSAILPGALRIFGNRAVTRLNPDGKEAEDDQPVPFRDGSILLSASLRDVLDVPPDALYTDLKWSGEKGRAAGLYLHQLMLLTALQARCGGASSLNWRAAVPDEMAQDGRENLVRLLDSLALRVSRESGLPFPEKTAPVSYASESAALGAYFRFCSPEETRGGFLLLDVGADTADISLFLRGRESAVRTCQLPLGVHYMLLPSLLARPETLAEDFTFVGDPVFLGDLEALRALLVSAQRDSAALRQARYALDAFIADYMPLLFQAMIRRMMDGAPSVTCALLLLHLAWLMMLSGLILLQISADPGKNDFLPERMSLCLSGRGAGLLEAFPDPVKAALWRILTMFRNPRVSSLSLLFSSEKKLEIPVGLSFLNETRSGLPSASAVPVSIQIRPEELVPEFLNRFRREFPMEAQLLFPGVYSGDPYAPFTSHGLQLISGALSRAFAARETPRPYTALAACLAELLENAREEAPAFVSQAPDPGAAVPPSGGDATWNA